jgi:hypothetical protein
MKEAYNNRLVTEDGEEQGATMENPPADVTAIVKAVNARLQGKAEYREAAQALLEYIIEYKQEGGTATDLLYVCQQVLGDDAKLVYPILKRLGERRANAKAREQVSGDAAPDSIMNAENKEQSLQGFMIEISDALEDAKTPKLVNFALLKAVRAMKNTKGQGRNSIDDITQELIKKFRGSLPEINTRVGNVRVTDPLELFDALQNEAGIQ